MTAASTELATILAAYGDEDQPAATFSAAAAVLGRSPGFRLLSVLALDAGRGGVTRIYSSDPVVYPVGGTKTGEAQGPPVASEWVQRLFVKGEPWLGRRRADVEAIFADHALITSLGCESFVNMPVRWRGVTVGVVNIFHDADHFRPEQLPSIRAASQTLLPTLLDQVGS